MQPENSPDFPSHDQWLDGDWLTYGGSSGNHRLFSSSFDSSSFDFIDQKPKTTNRKSLSASENHKEAERRRRERINGHLDSLRAILLCNSKIDKASLLAKVVERVRELKRETSDIFRFDQSSFPSEADESTVVLQDNDDSVENNGRSMFKASLCCEDRVNLLPELIDILKPLPLSIVSAEIVTLGGRVRNVIVLAGERNRETDEAVLSLESSLQTMVQRSSFVDGERMKRRRMFDQMIVG